MAEPESAQGDGAQVKKKGGGLISTIAVVVVLSAVAAGGGWFIGGMLSGKFITQEKKDELARQAADIAAAAASDAKGGEKKKPGEDDVPHLSAQEQGVVALEPITSNLASPPDAIVRLDVALVFDGKPDDKIGEAVQQDIMAYLRTVSLQQLQGARGFEYLHEDIRERAEIRSEGHVKDVLFRTFLIQ